MLPDFPYLNIDSRLFILVYPIENCLEIQTYKSDSLEFESYFYIH